MVFPPIFFFGGVGEWRRSEHAHASYPGLFFRPPGFSPHSRREEKESSGTGLGVTLTRSAHVGLSRATQTRSAFRGVTDDEQTTKNTCSDEITVILRTGNRSK